MDTIVIDAGSYCKKYNDYITYEVVKKCRKTKEGCQGNCGNCSHIAYAVKTGNKIKIS